MQLESAENAHNDYPTSDRVMKVVYDKADWYNCRDCKTAYKTAWDQIQENDEAFEAKIKVLLNQKVVITADSLTELIELVEENVGLMKEMDVIFEGFRRVSV